MQLLVYLTVLMVAASTVLLEVHWLTSPDPQLNPSAQTRTAQASKIESEVRAMYPDPSGHAGTAAQVQTTDAREAPGGTPATNTVTQPAPPTTISPPPHLPPGPSPASTPHGSASAQVPPQHPSAMPEHANCGLAAAQRSAS